MKRTWAHVRAELRQRRQHRPFRIGPPEWDERRRARVELALGALEADGGGLDRLDEKALADAATKLFQARRKLPRTAAKRRDATGAERDRASPEARAAGRYLDHAEEELSRAGLVVQDHTGEGFRPGQSLKVVAYEDVPGLAAETVIETVKPTVYLRDHRIQMGEVIVGRPGGPDTNDSREDDE